MFGGVEDIAPAKSSIESTAGKTKGKKRKRTKKQKAQDEEQVIEPKVVEQKVEDILIVPTTPCLAS